MGWTLGQRYRTWGVADPAIHRPDGGGRGHARQGRATACGSVGARVGYLGLGIVAHRPRLLWGPGAGATGPRRIRCIVLPELGGVGRGAL
jgi:hypothetical protein